jgi:hypothetical protein
MKVNGRLHAPAALYRRNNHGTHWIESWAGLRVGLDSLKKRNTPGRPTELLQRNSTFLQNSLAHTSITAMKEQSLISVSPHNFAHPPYFC